MRTADDVALVRRLVAEDLNDCEVARRTSIPRETIRDWRRAGFRPPSGRRLRDGADHAHDFRQLPRSYAYLLGLYLGDGNITQHPRRVFRLRVTLDERYPLIVAACQASMAEVMPASRASIQMRRDGACVEVYSFSKPGRASCPSTVLVGSTSARSCWPTGNARSATATRT